MKEKNNGTYTVNLPYATGVTPKAEGKAFCLYVVRREYGTMTDTASAYLRAIAPRYAYTALKTIYQRSADNNILRLMNEIIAITHSAQYSGIFDYLDTEAEDGTPDGLQEVKLRKYTIQTRKDGKRYRTEIVPEEELTQTDNGAEYLRIDTASLAGLDAEDIIQEALVALVSLANEGIITDYDSVHNVRRLVYRAVNAYVLAERRRTASAESYDNLLVIHGYDDDGKLTERIAGGRNARNIVSKWDLTETEAAIIEYICRNSHKNVNKKALTDVFYMRMIENLPVEQIERRTGIKAQHISNYVRYIAKVTETPEFRQFLTSLIG